MRYSSRNHYGILDGLRGVASLTVVAFHLYEAYSADADAVRRAYEPFATVKAAT